MRLWSLHPQYLDAQGLVALWREALLARAVLRGETKGYQHHPQLIRFYAHPQPLDAIEYYLHGVYEEASLRGYSFNRDKLSPVQPSISLIQVTDGQLNYEWQHLTQKIAKRSPKLLPTILSIAYPKPHSIFQIIDGEIASWEKLS